MASDDEIVQKITIEVEGDKAADALKEIGEKAQSSFEELEKAAKTAGVSIEDFGRLSAKTQQQYVELSQRVQQSSEQIVQSTQEVQQAAGRAGEGTKDLGGGLDQVSQKSGVSNREMRALGKVMKEFGAGEVAGLATGLVKMANVFGPLGVAVLLAAEAFAFLKGKMKEAEEQAKATTATMANMAKISAEMHAESDASFWGTTADGMKKVANDASQVADQLRNIASGAKEVISSLTSPETETKAFIMVLERAGISVGDVMADTKKLGEASQKAALEAAKIYEKMSPIEKLNFEKVLKDLKFPEDTIKNIEKGSESLRKLQEQAAKPFFTPEQQKSIDNLAKGWDAFVAASKRAWAMVAGDAETGASGLAQRIGAAFAKGFADMMAIFGQLLRDQVQRISTWINDVKALIAEWVTTPIANAWGWVKETWEGIGSWFKTKIDEATAALTAWVTTPIANAWQWIKDTFYAVMKSLFGKYAPTADAGGGGTVAAEGHASGGEIRGRSGTDTNLAWLTAGEFVMRREAVQRYGTGLMHAINSLQAPRFAMGGLNIARPSLGSVSAFGGGLSNVTINFPGLPEITGLRASSNVVDNLRHAAAMAQVRSGGRKPSRYG